GAIGLSSGLEYDPGFYSKTDELVALGAVVAKYGGYYMSHVRNENEGAFASWREAIEIGRRNRIPVEISHIKLGVKPVWGRAAEGLKILDDARREGVKVIADWYPYSYWQSSSYVLIETRDFESRAAWERGLNDIGGAGNVLITSYRPDASLNGKTLAEIAEARGKDAVTTAIEMMREAGPGTGVIATSMSEDDLTTFVKSPLVLVCSDGSLTGRHPRGYGTFPRVLARYVRDLEAIALPDAVAKMTGRSAAQLGMPGASRLAGAMIALVAAEGPLLDEILASTFEIWSEGLSRRAYAKYNAAQRTTPWGRAHLRHWALVDGGQMLASAKEYLFDATLDGRAI